jgi:Sulfotransferase family
MRLPSSTGFSDRHSWPKNMIPPSIDFTRPQFDSMVKISLNRLQQSRTELTDPMTQDSHTNVASNVGDYCDLYNSGEVAHAIVADYPGSVLRIYKRQFNGLPWPLWQMLILRDRKLVYNPIAKSGSSSLRAAIIAMSDIPDELKALQLETHTTGLQLGDLPRQEALDILHDHAYLKFTVIRDPFERLVSAYLDKFVLNRSQPGNQFHTRGVIAGVAGRSQLSQEDFNRSISFAEFVDYIVAQRPESLDPHWCPQHLHLLSAIHRVFRLDDLDEVTKLLRLSVDFPRYNVTRNAPRPVPDAHRLAASEIPCADVVTESFFDARIRRQVESYYALDFTLWEAAATKTRSPKQESQLVEAEKRVAEERERSWLVKLRQQTRPLRRALFRSASDRSLSPKTAHQKSE